jgi:hypothetical protein
LYLSPGGGHHHSWRPRAAAVHCHREDFGFSNISIDRNNPVVDTSYSSMGATAAPTSEVAFARSAPDDRHHRSHPGDPDHKKSKGATITARADAARIETTGRW